MPSLLNNIRKTISYWIQNPLVNLALYLLNSYILSISLVVLIAIPEINSSLWNVKLNQFVSNKWFVLIFFSQLAILVLIKLKKESKLNLIYKTLMLRHLAVTFLILQILTLMLFNNSPLTRMLFLTSTSILITIQFTVIVSNTLTKGSLKKIQEIDVKNHKFELLGFLLPTVLIGAFYLVFVILRHHTFSTHAWDLALYDQSVWLFSKFSTGTNTVIGLSAFGDHLELPTLLLAPLYWMYSSPYVLLVVQVIAILVGGIPIYKLAKEKLQSSIAASFLLTSYLLFFGIQSALNFDFHPLVLALPFLSYALYFLEKKRMRALVATVLPILLIKENLSMYTSFIGLYLALKKRYRKIGLFILLGSLIYFLFTVKLLLPFLLQSPYKHFLFKNWGGDFFSAFINIIANPLLAFKTLVTPSIKLETILMALGSGAFLIFIAPSYLFLMIPLFVERFLSTKHATWLPIFHYSSLMAPYITFAGITAIASISRHIKKKSYVLTLLLSTTVLMSTILINYRGYKEPIAGPFLSFSKYGFMFSPKDKWSDVSSINDAISLIEKDASVASQDAILPHLTHRSELYQIGKYDFDAIKPKYVLINEELGSWPLPKSELKQLVNYYLQVSDYELVFSKNKTYLFKRIQ